MTKTPTYSSRPATGMTPPGFSAIRKINIGGHQTVTVLGGDVTSAYLKIKHAEEDLGRTLSRGERNDLIIDNFTKWPSTYCRALVAALEGQ